MNKNRIKNKRKTLKVSQILKHKKNQEEDALLWQVLAQKKIQTWEFIIKVHLE